MCVWLAFPVRLLLLCQVDMGKLTGESTHSEERGPSWVEVISYSYFGGVLSVVWVRCSLGSCSLGPGRADGAGEAALGAIREGVGG